MGYAAARKSGEARSVPRFPVSWRLHGQELSLAGVPQARGEVIAQGRIQDISLAGICLVTDQPYADFNSCAARFFLPMPRWPFLPWPRCAGSAMTPKTTACVWACASCSDRRRISLPD
jgi:hypothetical protein